MFLELDFEQRIAAAVLSEIANRSDSEPSDPAQVISASPVTHSHFGGTCYYSRHHKRFAWVRPYTLMQDGRPVLQKDRFTVSFGHYSAPPEWQNEQHTNHMKHSVVNEIAEAANQILAFLIEGTLPTELFPGDYHYREPLLKA